MTDQVKRYLEQNTFEHFKEVQESFKSFNKLNEFSLIPGQVIEFGSFNQQIQFLSLLLVHKQGQDLLPHREELLIAMANFICFPQVTAGPGKIVSECMKMVLQHDTKKNTKVLETLLPMLSVSNGKDSAKTAPCVVNVLSILSDPSILKAASLKLAPKISGLLSVYGNHETVRKSILIIAVEASRNDDLYLNINWRNLFCKVLEEHSNESEIVSKLTVKPAGLIMVQRSIKPNLIIQHLHDSPGLICRSRNLSELLIAENILEKEMEMMWKLLIGEDEFAQYWPNDDLVDQLAESHILHLMLIFSSFEFISSSGEEISTL